MFWSQFVLEPERDEPDEPEELEELEELDEPEELEELEELEEFDEREEFEEKPPDLEEEPSFKISFSCLSFWFSVSS